MWNSCLLRQPVPRTVALARGLFEFAESNGNPAQLAIVYRALGYSLFMAGELVGAAEALAKGAALADVIPDSDFSIYGEHPSLVCRAYESQVRALMGYRETAASLGEAAIMHARNQNNPHSLAWALNVCGLRFLGPARTRCRRASGVRSRRNIAQAPPVTMARGLRGVQRVGDGVTSGIPRQGWTCSTRACATGTLPALFFIRL